MKALFQKIYRTRALLYMVLPAAAVIFVFQYIPMGGLVLAFKQYKVTDGFWNSKWVGFKNFRFFFMSNKATELTLNTMLYNLTFILVNNITEVVCAVILAEITSKVFKKAVQTALLFPYFMSWIIVSSIVYNLFNYDNGLVNGYLKSIGAEPINMYENKSAWRYIIIFFNAWKSVGYGTVVYYAAIMSIDGELYDVAQIDGANIYQTTLHITIPGISPTIVTLVLLSVARIFRGDFGLFYNLIGNNGYLLETTDIIDTYVFRALFQSSEVGMSSAVGFYQSVLCFVTIITVNAVTKLVSPDYALF